MPGGASEIFRVVPWVVVLLPAIAGVLALIRGLRILSIRRSLRREGARARGEIVDNSMTSHTEGRIVFAPVVRFRVADGSEVTAVGDTSSSRSFVVGSGVDLSYDPARPERITIEGGRGRSGAVLVAVGIAFLAFAMVGAVFATAIGRGIDTL